MKTHFFATLILSLALLCSCATDPNVRRGQVGGAVIGGVGTGLITGSWGGAAVGAVMGGFVGGEMSR